MKTNNRIAAQKILISLLMYKWRCAKEVCNGDFSWEYRFFRLGEVISFSFKRRHWITDQDKDNMRARGARYVRYDYPPYDDRKDNAPEYYDLDFVKDGKIQYIRVIHPPKE